MPTRRVVRKVQPQTAEFDEQLWPINGTLVILAGCIAGLIVAVGDFDAAVWYCNAWTHLLGLAASVVALVLGTAYVSTRRGARRMQLAVLLALGLHLWLAVVLYVVPVYLQTGRHRPSAWVDETPKITFPDYGRAAHEQLIDPEVARPEEVPRPENAPQVEVQRTAQPTQQAHPTPQQSQQEPVPAAGSVNRMAMQRAVPSASRQSAERRGQRIRRAELAVREPRPRLQAQLAQGQQARQPRAMRAQPSVQVRKQAVGPSQQVQTAMTRSPVPQPALEPQAVRRADRREAMPRLNTSRRLAGRTTVSPVPQATAAAASAQRPVAAAERPVRAQAPTGTVRRRQEQARLAAVAVPQPAPRMESPAAAASGAIARRSESRTPQLQAHSRSTLARQSPQAVPAAPRAEQAAVVAARTNQAARAVASPGRNAPRRSATTGPATPLTGTLAGAEAAPGPAPGAVTASAATRRTPAAAAQPGNHSPRRVALQRAQAGGIGAVAQAQAATLPTQGATRSGTSASAAAQSAGPSSTSAPRLASRQGAAAAVSGTQSPQGAPAAATETLGASAASGSRTRSGRAPTVGSAGGRLARLGRQAAAGQAAPQSQAALAALATGKESTPAAAFAGSGAPATGARRQATSSSGGAAAQLAASAGESGNPQTGSSVQAAVSRSSGSGGATPRLGSRAGIALARNTAATGGAIAGPQAALAQANTPGGQNGGASPRRPQAQPPGGGSAPGRLARGTAAQPGATSSDEPAPGVALGAGSPGGPAARRSTQGAASAGSPGTNRNAGTRLARASTLPGAELPGLKAAQLAGPPEQTSEAAATGAPAEPTAVASTLARRSGAAAGVPGTLAAQGDEPSAAVTAAPGSASPQGGARREGRPLLSGGSRQGTTLARSTGTGYITTEVNAEELGPVPQELSQVASSGTPNTQAAGMRRHREDHLAVDVVAREGTPGVALDRPGELGLPLARARPDASTVATTSHRFRLERAPLAGVELAPEVEAIPAPAFRGRDPRRRGQVAQSRGGSPQTERAVEAGLAFLARHQMPDGSWSLHRFAQGKGYPPSVGLGRMQSDTAATGLALLAFLGAGYTHQQGKYRQEVAAGLKWLIERQKPNGDLFTGGSRYAWLYSHGIAAIALCEAYGMTQDPQLRRPAQRAVDFIVAAQHPTLGGWRYAPRVGTDTSVSGWQLMALKSAEMAGLNVPEEVYSRLRTWLQQAQWPEDVALYVYRPKARYQHQRTPSRAMTAEALLMQLYLGTSPQSTMIQRGARYLGRNLPSFGSPGRLQRDTYYWYYATQVMFHAGGEHWDRWNRRQRALLVNTQVQEGPLAGSWDPLGRLPDRWGAEGGRIYVTAMHLLILEVYYRHLPLYRPQVVAGGE